MARKMLLCVFLVLLVVTFYAYAGEVKLTTYYPAPYGEYKRVVTTTLGVGDNDASGTITSADAPDPATQAGNLWVAEKLIVGPARRANPRSRFQFAAGAMEVQNPGEYPWGISIDIPCWRYYTGATPNGWAREFKFSNNEGQLNAATPNQPLAGSALQKDVMFAFGVYGGGQTLNYGYIGGSTDLNAETAYLTPWMVFKPDGKVGIGTTTPGNILEVRKDIASTANGITLNNQQGSGWGSTITFSSKYTSAYNASQIVGGGTSSQGNGILQFLTAFNSTLSPRMTITNLGRVGINTADPQEMFEVAGGVATSSTAARSGSVNRGIMWNGYPGNYNGNQLHIQFAGASSGISVDDEIWIGTNGANLAGHINMQNRRIHLQTSTGGIDGYIELSGGVWMHGNTSCLVVPQCSSSGALTQPIVPGETAIRDGAIYYDTTARRFKVKVNGSWVFMSTSAT